MSKTTTPRRRSLKQAKAHAEHMQWVRKQRAREVLELVRSGRALMWALHNPGMHTPPFPDLLDAFEAALKPWEGKAA